MDEYVVNSAYIVSMLAMGIREVLPFRILLLFTQALFLWWGTLIDLHSTVVWNSVFMAINAAVIGRIVWERRAVVVPEEFRDIHDTIFPGLRARDFVFFLEMGNPHQVCDTTLVTQGELPQALKLILGGTAKVLRDGQHIADIGRGSFVAEMSLLTGLPASADVIAIEPVQYVSWSRRKIDNLARLNPQLYLILQKALGRDVSRKALGQG